MYAAASVSSGQGFHFSRRYQVEIAFDRVFQGRGGSCEFDGLCRSGCQQSVDNAGGKSVSASYAVHDGSNVIMAGLMELAFRVGLPAVVDQGLPSVVGSGVGFSERGSYIAESEFTAMARKVSL